MNMSENIDVKPSKIKTRSVTIADDATASSAFRLNGPIVGISYPSATYTAATLTLTVSPTKDGTYHNVGISYGGTAAPSIAIVDGAATYHPCEPALTAGARWCKLNINADNNADITFTVYEAK